MCILIVEDEPIVLMCATESFEAGGHEVMAADHGREAVTMIAANAGHFTALITDFNMPFGVSGGDLIEHMRISLPEYR